MRQILFTFSMLLSFSVATNELPGFADGPVIEGYGMHKSTPTNSVNAETRVKVAFDVAKDGDPGKVNRKFDSLARFINMHVAAGVLLENIDLALVVHGRAAMDLLDNASYQRVHSEDNPNIELLNLLMQNRVQIILCGQTAGAYEISPKQLIKGVKIELSAMTAHALLQQQGYTVNPF